MEPRPGPRACVAMPQLTFSTPVRQPLAQVQAGFTRALFEALAPPFPPVRVLRFDGCAPGDQVHLELHFGFFRQRWVSHIVSASADAQHWQFIDEGRELPFFLRQWRHVHRVEALPQGGARIVDAITYQGPNALVSLLLWPSLWLQFAYRGPIYRRRFARPSGPVA